MKSIRYGLTLMFAGDNFNGGCSDIYAISGWSKLWRLGFNVKKFVHLCFSKNQEDIHSYKGLLRRHFSIKNSVEAKKNQPFYISIIRSQLTYFHYLFISIIVW